MFVERGDGSGRPAEYWLYAAATSERPAGRHQADGEEQDQEDDGGDPSEHGSRAPLAVDVRAPAVALAPREAGLHLWPHDSIGGVNERSSARTLASHRVETTRRASL